LACYAIFGNPKVEQKRTQITEITPKIITGAFDHHEGRAKITKRTTAVWFIFVSFARFVVATRGRQFSDEALLARRRCLNLKSPLCDCGFLCIFPAMKNYCGGFGGIPICGLNA
jgi:hypothetical protein